MNKDFLYNFNKMWKIFFYVVVLVELAMATPQHSKDLPLEDMTGANLLNNIELLVEKNTHVLIKPINDIPGLILGQPSAQSKLNRPESCLPCNCGALGSKHKIIGGKEVKYAHKYPWMAMVLLWGSFKCGASLINNKYVLTAAHCIESLEPSDYAVRLSVLRRNTSIFQEYNVKRIIVHESFMSEITLGRGLVNDIALIRLDTDGVKMSTDLHPVCMLKQGLSYANEKGVATGWGLMDLGDDFVRSDVLREVELHVFSNRVCKLHDRPWLTENTVCAGLRDEGKTTCAGDSGGPLTVAYGSAHHLIGISSFGKNGCRMPPSVFTRVSVYLDWIKANTEDACTCKNN